MRKLIVLAFFMSFQHLQAQESEIRQSIATFFDGFPAKDSLKIKSVCSDTMVLQSVSESPKGTKLSTEKASEFLKSIVGIPAEMKFEERLLSYKIQVDGAMAHAWVPYEFYINGKLSHEGVNSFQLFKENAVWKIIYIVDTRRRS